MVQLVERAEQLTLLRALFSDARSGKGHLVYVCADAGGGKSALVQAFCDAVASQANILTGWCDPFDTPRPAGPLLDMGAGLGAKVMQTLRDDGRSGLFDAVLAELAGAPRPIVFVVEDAHWADGTTLDLVRFLGRRIAGLPALVIVTYRDDEIGPAHPLRAVLGDLTTQRGVTRVRLPPLSLVGVSELAASSSVEPHRVVDPQQVLATTGGNPFFVTEVLQHPEVDHVPETVADTVLARLGRISASARYAVTVVAMLGTRAEPSLLYDLPGVGADDLEEAVHAGLMRLVGQVFTFRHELVRQAVLSLAASAQRRAIAGDVLAVLRVRMTSDDAFGQLAELAEIAADATAVAQFAPAAARRATELGAHREAAAQYERALRHVESDTERADLLESLAVERYLLGEIAAAVIARTAAAEVRSTTADLHRLGDDLRWLGQLYWYTGDSARAMRHAMEALECLRPLGPSPELAMALSQLSQLHMLAGSYSEAISLGEQALALSRELGLPDVTAHGLNSVGTARAAGGDDMGLEQLRESLAVSLEINSEDHAARAYVNLAGELLGQRRITEAMAVTEEAIEYCLARDLDLQTPNLRSIRAQLAVHAGRWDEAVIEATAVLRDSSGTPVTAYVARLPLAIVALRRGQQIDLGDLALRARELNELHRLWPYACIRAEALWLTRSEVPTDCDIIEIYAQGMTGETNHEMTELGIWLARLGLPVGPTVDAAGPLRGAVSEPLQCAERVLALGNPYDAALCLLAGDESDVRSAAVILSGLGASLALARAQARLRELGATRIPRGPRRETATHELGLTARQSDVLALVSEGLTNSQIAARLFLSERTVEHHVSAVLAKLSVSSRDEAATRYRYRQPSI